MPGSSPLDKLKAAAGAAADAVRSAFTRSSSPAAPAEIELPDSPVRPRSASVESSDVTPVAVITTVSPVLESPPKPRVAVTPHVVDPSLFEDSPFEIAHNKLETARVKAEKGGDNPEQLNEKLMSAAREFALAHYMALQNDLSYKDESNFFTAYEKKMQEAVAETTPSAKKDTATKVLKVFNTVKEEIKAKKEKKVEKEEMRFKLGSTKEKKPCIEVEAQDLEPLRAYLQQRFGAEFKVSPPGPDGVEDWKVPSNQSLDVLMQEMKTHLENKTEGTKLKIIDYPSEKEVVQWKSQLGLGPVLEKPVPGRAQKLAMTPLFDDDVDSPAALTPTERSPLVTLSEDVSVTSRPVATPSVSISPPSRTVSFDDSPLGSPKKESDDRTDTPHL